MFGRSFPTKKKKRERNTLKNGITYKERYKQYLICFPDKLNIGCKVWFYDAGKKRN